MKKINQLLVAAALMFSSIISAQAPNLLSYQAVVRNSSNNIVINQSVGMRISILQSSATGTPVYIETQTATSNANGLVSLQIGGGTVVTGTFANINWAGNTYFVKTETDPAGGTNYSITGTQQLLSVPYALSAKNGVPTGGTTNQVLAKVNGTDFNAQWVTPTFTTTYPNVELDIRNNVSQSITSLGNGTSANLVIFSGSNSANAALTGGNTWNGSTFTVGSTGAGWYQINAQIVGTTTDGVSSSVVGIPFYMDLNNAIGGTMTSAILYRSNYTTQTNSSHLKNNNTINTLLYLSAGNTLNFYGFSASNSVTGNTSNNGGTYLNIIRIK